MPASGSLYVFLHGLTVVHEKPNELEVVLPQVAGHVFKAGSWLMEKPIGRRAQLTLQGVQPNNGPLQLSHAIEIPRGSLTNRDRAATLHLPIPAAVLELLVVGPYVDQARGLTRGPLAVLNDGSARFDFITTLPVLQYSYGNENQVSLEGHYWEPCATDGSISLHIISTSEGPEGLAHEAETERVLSQVIQGYPGLTFFRPEPVAPMWNETTSLNYGLPQGSTWRDFVYRQGRFAFAQEEMENVMARCVRLDRLGRMKQQGRPLRNLWHEPDPIGIVACDCGSMFLRLRK